MTTAAQPAKPVGTFFGFMGMPATITIQKKDGTYVEGKRVEPKPEGKKE